MFRVYHAPYDDVRLQFDMNNDYVGQGVTGVDECPDIATTIMASDDPEDLTTLRDCIADQQKESMWLMRPHQRLNI